MPTAEDQITPLTPDQIHHQTATQISRNLTTHTGKNYNPQDVKPTTSETEHPLAVFWHFLKGDNEDEGSQEFLDLLSKRMKQMAEIDPDVETIEFKKTA